jgi:hypothetical protein
MGLPLAFKFCVSFYRWIRIGDSADKVFQEGRSMFVFDAFAALIFMFFIIPTISPYIRILPILPGNPILQEFGNRINRGYGVCRNPLGSNGEEPCYYSA